MSMMVADELTSMLNLKGKTGNCSSSMECTTPQAVVDEHVAQLHAIAGIVMILHPLVMY
jgi:hypothetical protein